MFSRVDEDAMVQELPPTLKEEVFFHQFGDLIQKQKFLSDMESNECVWGIVRNLEKIKYEKNDKIFQNQELSEMMYMIKQGKVRIYAENNYPFETYQRGDHFGDAELFCGTRRNGTAQAADDCHLYKIHKNQLEDVLTDFPKIKQRLVEQAITKN